MRRRAVRPRDAATGSAAVRTGAGGGRQPPLRSSAGTSPQAPARNRARSTTQRGIRVSTITSPRSSQMPGVLAAKSGKANHTTSNAKWKTIAGTRPKSR